MKQLTSLLPLLFITQLLCAQAKTLAKEGMSWGASKDITKVTIQAETEKTISLQAEYKGFDEKNKSYKITATILNQLKKPMREFQPVTLDLDPRGSLIDLSFSFTQQSGVKYAPEGIRSAFIEFSVAENKGDNTLFGSDVLGIGASKFVFQLKKTWKVKVATTVEVKLVPYSTVPKL
jgi:hypothetical protein